MIENNCFQKVLIKNLCGPMRHESWQKVQKGISDSDKLKYYKCVETLALQERARWLVRSLLEHLFHFLFLFYYINNDRPEVH